MLCLCVYICETSNVRRINETRNLCVRTFFGLDIYLLFIFPLSSVQVFFSYSLVRLLLLHWQHCTYTYIIHIQCALFFSSSFFFNGKFAKSLFLWCFVNVKHVYIVVYGANFLTNSWSPFEWKRCTNLYHASIHSHKHTNSCWHKKREFCMPMVFFHRHVSYTYFLFAHSLNWLFSRIWLAFAYIIFLKISSHKFIHSTNDRMS